MRLLIAARLCAFADDCVVGEHIARIQDRTVDGLGGQTDIVRARCVALVEVGCGTGERIAEQTFPEDRLRDRRLRDGDRNGVACLRAVTDDLLCFFNIELHAGLAGDDGLAVLLADGRVDRTAGDILCNFVDVDGRRSGHIGRDLIGFEIHQLDLRGERCSTAEVSNCTPGVPD